jgi:hypothetical protein
LGAFLVRFWGEKKGVENGRILGEENATKIE